MQVTPGARPSGPWRRRVSKGNSLSADHGHRRGQRGGRQVLLSGLWDLPPRGCSARERPGLRAQGGESQADSYGGCLCVPTREPGLQGSHVRPREPSAWPPGPWLLVAACSRSCCPQGPGSRASITAQLPHPTILMLTHEDIPSPTLLVWFSQRVPFPQEKRLPTTYPE